MTRREAFCSQVWIHSNHMARLLTFYHVHSMVQSVRRAEFDTKQTINSQWNKHRKKKGVEKYQNSRSFKGENNTGPASSQCVSLWALQIDLCLG